MKGIIVVVMAFCFAGVSAKNFSKDYVQENPFKRYFKVDVTLFTSNLAMGQSDGNVFCCNVDCQDEKPPQSGNTVRSLKAWYYFDEVVALQIRLSDDSFCTIGSPSNQISETFVIGPGERITSLKLWANDETGYFGGFDLTTDQNRHFSVNEEHYFNVEPFEPELGSGILVGAFGVYINDNDGTIITCLGFALLRRGSAEMTDVAYLDLSMVPDIKPKEIQTIMYDNTYSTAEQVFSFKGSEKMTTSQFWSLPGGLESTLRLKIQAGIPIIEFTESIPFWKVSVVTAHSASNVQTAKQFYEFPLTAPAGKHLKATAILYEGNIEIQYNASILCTLVSGKPFSYDVSGIYKGLAVSQISVSVERF